MYIHRDCEKTLKKASSTFPSIVLTGPRQSGKSTLLKYLFGKSHAYFTFDDPLIRDKAAADPRLFLENSGDKLILDEIQYVPELTSYMKMLIDQERNIKGRFILTGSQRFHLIKNLGDSLAGRVGIFELLPFNLSEKSSAPGFKGLAEQPLQAFVSACLRGSYPQPVVEKKLDFNQWSASYFQTYIERDVRSVFDIGNLRDFQRFIQILAARCAQILNLNSIASEIGISVNTVKRWLSVLEAGRVVYLLYPYYQNLGKRVTKAPKVYFLDCGLVCYLTGINQKKALLDGPLAGPLFENFCIQETVKIILNSSGNTRIYYLRTNNDLEVDLLIEKGLLLYPCEIKLSKTIRYNFAGAIERFRNVFDKLNIGEGKIISLSSQNERLTRNVSAVTFSEYIRWLKEKSK